ncbi:MAG: hypothetical protein ABFD66_00145 [Smithella sp.]
MQVPVTFYFLYLLEPEVEYREEYDEISKNIIEKTCRLSKIYGTIPIEEKHDPEEWCKLSLNIDGLNAEVKYYKERLIVKIVKVYQTEILNQLFKEVKKTRRTLLQNPNISLENIQKKFNSDCKSCIEKIYLYPLIEINKEYKSKNYNQAGFNLEDEAITTFFYEIPDIGDMDKIFFNFIPIRYKEVLMRVSGPSIIATKMSDIMRAKLINLIYESALYKMRDCERNNPLVSCKKVYGENYEDLRNYIAETFFQIESGSSQIEVNSTLYILSYIMALGAFAGIIAIFYAIPVPLEYLKTFKWSDGIVTFFRTPLLLKYLKTIAAIVLVIVTMYMIWIIISLNKTSIFTSKKNDTTKKK